MMDFLRYKQKIDIILINISVACGNLAPNRLFFGLSDAKKKRQDH